MMYKKILGMLFIFMLIIVPLITVVAVDIADFKQYMTKEEKYEPNVGILGEVLLEEDFEDGIMPPPDWDVIDGTQTDNHWEIIDAATEPGLVRTGEYAALVNWDTSNQDEWLISPQVDLTGNLETVNLTFWANTSYYSSRCTVYVYVDIGDGFNHVVWNMVVDEPDWPGEQIYREVDLDLSEFIGEVVIIKWHYEGDRLFFPFALDDILVYVGEMPIIEIGEITGGWRGLGLGGKVSAVIENTGEGDATEVYWNISITGNGVVEPLGFYDEGMVPMITSNGSETIQYENDTKPIRGLGMINITVYARCAEGSEDMKSVDGFLLFFIVIILD